MPNDEIGDLLTEIVKLHRKVSGLTLVAQVNTSSLFEVE
jgi:hypothetical protein